jgi:hypothetical protein
MMAGKMKGQTMKVTATTRSHQVMLMVLALLVTTYMGYAQQASKTLAQSSSQADSEKRAGNNFDSSFASTEFAFDGRGLVQGAPFSAVGVKETTQILSDGRRIQRRRTTSIYRAGLGSTRFEWGNNAKTAGTAGTPIIFDAVTGTSYFLSTGRHRALQLSLPVKDASLRQAKIITPQSPPENIAQVVGETIELLGTQMIEGIKVEGVRVTTTVPATEMRSKQSGKVVYERWYSQELRRTILLKCTDPRFGEAVFKLTNIDRSEPAPELFTVPAGYTIDLFTTAKPTRTLKSSYSK